MAPKPKKKCCVSKPRCKRCPIRLLAAGKLPDGYTVKRRRLVKVADAKVSRSDKNKPEKSKSGKDKPGKKSGKKHGKPKLPDAA